MKFKSWLITLLISTVLTHVIVLLFTPYFMMAATNWNLGQTEGYGKLLIKPQAIAGEDVIVRTSPDLLYSACAFDMDEGPYRISMPAMDSYMSVSFFAHNTDNFLAMNDRDSPEGIDLVLAKKGGRVSLPVGAELVETDTPYGLILMRYYLGDQSASDFDQLRQQAICEKMG